MVDDVRLPTPRAARMRAWRSPALLYDWRIPISMSSAAGKVQFRGGGDYATSLAAAAAAAARSNESVQPTRDARL